MSGYSREEMVNNKQKLCELAVPCLISTTNGTRKKSQRKKETIIKVGFFLIE